MPVNEEKCMRCAFLAAFNGKGEPICRLSNRDFVNYCEYRRKKIEERANDPSYQYVQKLVLEIEADVKKKLEKKRARRIYG